MGLHADVRRHVRETMPQVHLTRDALTASAAPEVCVLDYMWLLYRFRGGSGRELVRFVQSQIRSAYKAGCVCFVALGDNDARVPEEKRAEQRRRDRRSAKIEDADRFLTHDHAPANWCEALSDRTFKQAVLLYLHHNVEPPSDAIPYVPGARLITRFASCGARLFRCVPKGEGWEEDATTDLEEVVRDGEADLAAARCIEWLAATQPYDSFVVRTIDSDSIPILLAAQGRLLRRGVNIYLWLPACERTVRANSGPLCVRFLFADLQRVTSTLFAQPVGEEVLRGVSTDSVHACAFEVPSDGFAGLWWEESRRILDMRCMLNAFDRPSGPWEFCLLCVMMGTDFNEKLNRGMGLKDIKSRIARAISTADPVRDYAKFFRVAASRFARPEVLPKQQTQVEWVLNYWRVNTLLGSVPKCCAKA
ncbi:hypothetical protein CYMTET_43358 [Cymbomonas tetramitiformis]|uniref:Uncharacterized protein n=1 Tax=Cymbomonas tetramitiformis TaxID=36881 RepID=A0AAE0F0Q3_9CHLO|nr:hypothetical protein CYMTET_43358 [Cymbomonas tetramitiformis]